MTSKNLNTDKILKARARLLAIEKVSDENEVEKLEILKFRIASESYGIELSHIRIIHPAKNLTYIPGTPDFIKGIINLRGELISVVDLKKFFDLPDQDLTDLCQVIILSSEDMEFGILADEILDVKKIPTNIIQPSLPTLTGIRSEYLKGITGDGIVILDGDKILTSKNMIIHIEVSG